MARGKGNALKVCSSEAAQHTAAGVVGSSRVELHRQQEEEKRRGTAEKNDGGNVPEIPESRGCFLFPAACCDRHSNEKQAGQIGDAHKMSDAGNMEDATEGDHAVRKEEAADSVSPGGGEVVCTTRIGDADDRKQGIKCQRVCQRC